ncbi:hypothetical protein Zmor_000545 [Zophobas morio]|uniref:Protein yellow n=1 Tax=Zophobas morio TaxID=2755281 RepID=A0AA38J104_9CUCU|nr:hypothetical protein Zmor_000545 [Zophobas morio]
MQRRQIYIYYSFGVLLLIFVKNVVCTIQLKEVFSWSTLDYAYANKYERDYAIATRQFIPENNLPVGIEIWKDKVFVTVPRWREGIPSTLNYIPLQQIEATKTPPLTPYPNWNANTLGNCESSLRTVYRIKADSCDRLWVLDTGTLGIGNTTQNSCPYALNVFDLKTNERIRRYQLRPEDINPNTFIANIAVDLGRNCEDTFAYMSDELGYGLIVYSWQDNISWRFSHGYFMPDPLAGDFNIGGLNFQWSEEGIFGLSLSPLRSNFERILYFSPLASYRAFGVSTNVLRNSSRTGDSYHDFFVLPKRGPNSHITAQVMSEDGIQLFNLIDRNAIGCWNSATVYGATNIGIVDKDDIGLIFPSDIKIDNHRNVWIMSDRMSNFLLAGLDHGDINFRIFVAPLNDLIRNSICEPKTHQNLNYFQTNLFDFNNRYVII